VLNSGAPGSTRFVILATDAPIDTSSLEQAGVRSSFLLPCNPEIESPWICNESESGARGFGARQLGDWQIAIVEVITQ
jgi:hypothetical protein